MVSARRRILSACLVAAASLGAPCARADEGDVLNFFSGLRYTYDDNLLRLPDGVTYFGKRSDFITSVFAGASLDKSVSRQRLKGQLAYYINRYANFTILDYQAPVGNASWLWQAGNQWSGQAAIEYSRSLTDFQDFGALLRYKNIMTTRQALLSASYLFHPDWSVLGQIARRDTDNNNPLRQSLDLNRATYELGVQHARPSGNRLGMTLRQARGDYPNRVFVPGVSTVDNRFKQDDLELRALWLPAGHSRFDARAGYTQLTYPDLQQRDFAAPIGRLSFDWFPNGKSTVNVTAGREITQYEQVGTSYVDRRYVRAAPTWNPTAKVALQAGLEMQRLIFAGETGFVANVQRRVDKIESLFLTLSWTPFRYLQLSANVQYGRRDSNVVTLDYTATSGYVAAQVNF